jgi:hypothetical protein
MTELISISVQIDQAAEHQLTPAAIVRLQQQPRSPVSDSVYGRKRSYTVSYTTVYMPYTLRIRPYFAIKHTIVCVRDRIRRNTETVSDRIFPCHLVFLVQN